MTVFITFIILWLTIPILGEVLVTLTTKSLVKISSEIDGFWDFMGGDEGTRRTLMLDDSEKAEINVDYPLSSAVEPPKGSWGSQCSYCGDYYAESVLKFMCSQGNNEGISCLLCPKCLGQVDGTV